MGTSGYFTCQEFSKMIDTKKEAGNEEYVGFCTEHEKLGEVDLDL